MGYGLEKDSVEATTKKYLTRVLEAKTVEEIKTLNPAQSVVLEASELIKDFLLLDQQEQGKQC